MYTTLHSYVDQLHYYVESSVSQTGTTEEIVEWIRANVYHRPKCFDYVIYVGKDGIYYSDDGNTGNVSDRTYFKAIFTEGRDYFIDSVIVSRNTGKLSFHVVKAIKQNGETIGFFGGIVDGIKNFFGIHYKLHLLFILT